LNLLIDRHKEDVLPQPIELKQLEASQSNLEDDADLDLTLVEDESQLVKEKSAIQTNLDIIPKSVIRNTETQNTTKSGYELSYVCFQN
jgi:hypothetical protein